ncbi:Uncharacterised protein [Serratia quinivorans]|uniref:hypothetical protein n=1 Tax=Serratia quinivorans TaxID=137545 RepID=UPI00217A1712|nr:hypothetical protein [Serratia quinivorans]CAI0710326.1 Uncharacterised protein [Serratia quinivorans]
MKERPVIFNGEMVRAILDGRKTQTRRAINWKRQPYMEMAERDDGSIWPWAEDCERGGDIWFPCQFGQVGDRLWVRETFGDCGDRLVYRADRDDGAACKVARWVPSIHMPRDASRILLEITGVRVERLNDISEEDASAEGVRQGIRRTGSSVGNEPVYCNYLAENLNDAYEWFDLPSDSFISLWQSIYGAESWQHSPWVWVIEFKRVGGSDASK